VNGFSFGRSKVTDKDPCYVIAEIGQIHQGDLVIGS
jgi:sialic acid synthase SpsE